MKIFVTAIGTDSGKTLVSSIITEALQADYWKPIQAGYPRDTEVVQSLISNSNSRFFSETYLLKSPESPHSAAEKEGILIELRKIQIPATNNHLVIEGAGGILVPINDHESVIDIAESNELAVILVSNIYLGSINHTLLSLEELKRRQINVLGIIFNGPSNPAAERVILKRSGVNCLLRVAQEEKVDKEMVKKYAALFKMDLVDKLISKDV